MPLYTDGEADGWTIEHSVRADGRVSVVKAANGTQLNLRFALGGSRADSPFVALVRPLGRARRRAPTRCCSKHVRRVPMRISAQLRARDAAPAGQRWTRSVFLDETLRRVALPLRDFLPAGHEAALTAGRDRARCSS